MNNPPASDLKTRALVGVLLIAVAIACIWFGGLAFAGLVALGALLIFAEWAVMHQIGRRWRRLGLIVLAGACSLAMLGLMQQALVLIAALALLMGVGARFAALASARWVATGLLYAGLPAVALIWLRAQPEGLAWVLWTLAIVWATDIFAYFAGRSIGGPRLAPRISPKKTWAGLVGGMLGAGFVGGVLAYVLGLPWAALAPAGAGLAVVAQAGDLYESWLKRRVGVKDSGTLLPGHGGIMDRVDGLVPVAVLMSLYLAVKGGVL